MMITTMIPVPLTRIQCSASHREFPGLIYCQDATDKLQDRCDLNAESMGLKPLAGLR